MAKGVFIWTVFKAVVCEELEFGACRLWANSSSLIQRSKEPGDNFRIIRRGYHWPIYITPSKMVRPLFVVQTSVSAIFKTWENSF